MNRKTGKKVAITLAAGAALVASGCSTLNGYTINGVPADKLYADSGNIKTDANVDNGSGNICDRHPFICVVGLGITGVIIWEIAHKSDNNNYIPVTPTPPPP